MPKPDNCSRSKAGASPRRMMQKLLINKARLRKLSLLLKPKRRRRSKLKIQLIRRMQERNHKRLRNRTRTLLQAAVMRRIHPAYLRMISKRLRSLFLNKKLRLIS